MGSMSKKQWKKFLLQGSRTGKVATVSPDGQPLIVPVWIDLDGDDVVFETDGESQKARNIEANPKVAICVDDERFPFSFVSIRGRARIERLAPKKLLPWTTRLSRRYVGDERAKEYGKRNAVEGGVLVRVSVDQVLAMEDIAA
jgi:PPOX class probable F420-dependent enzyme